MFRLQSLSPTITDMIRFDHSHVLVSYHQYTAGKPASVKKALAETVCSALEIHARLEEEIFYPVMRQLGLGESVLGKSVPEHNTMRQLIGDIRRAGDSAALDRLLPPWPCRARRRRRPAWPVPLSSRSCRCRRLWRCRSPRHTRWPRSASPASGHT